MTTPALLHRWCIAAGLALAILFAPGASLANGSILYRADSRGPEIIFREGFRGRGNNMNLVHHLSGASCWETSGGVERSAYVSMAEHPGEALLYATYVYRIRPDADAPDETAAFSALDGMNAVQRDRERHGLNLRQLSDIDALMGMPWIDGQYVSRRIPPEWIQAVMVYEMDENQTPVYQGMIVNPGYRPALRLGGRHAFTQAMIDGIRSHVPMDTHMRYAVAPNISVAPACMDPDDTCGGSGPRAFRQSLFGSTRARHQFTCVLEPLLKPGNRMQRAADIILSP